MSRNHQNTEQLFVELDEFCSLTGFNQAEICRLLAWGLLQFQAGTHGQLQLSVSELDLEALSQVLNRADSAIKTQHQRVVEEQLGQILLSQVAEMLPEAVELAISWLSPEQD